METTTDRGTVLRIDAAELQPGDYLWRVPVEAASVMVAGLRVHPADAGGTVVVNPRDDGGADAWLPGGLPVIVTRWATP